MKTCRKCGNDFPLDAFYVHAEMADGHLNICKECVKARVAAHRAARLEGIRAYDRERGRSEEHKARNRAYCNPSVTRKAKTEWAKRNQLKTRAERKAYRALRAGKIVKQDCWCGAPAEMHHPDYSQSLRVVWLCHSHHMELHRRYA